MQLDGLTVIAECGSRFEADLMAYRLSSDGVEASVLSDPAHQVAPHIVTQAGHRVVVADENADQARELLVSESDQPTATMPVGLGRRPRWFRWMAIALAAAVIGSFLIGLIDLLLRQF